MTDKPWLSEPLTWGEFESDGLRCFMARRQADWPWCGYVGVEKGHPWYGLDTSTIVKPASWMIQDRTMDDGTGPINFFMHALSGRDMNKEIAIALALHVHGSVTYAGHLHFVEAMQGDDAWWFGFDCGHVGDLHPAMHDNEFRAMRSFMTPEQQKSFEKKDVFGMMQRAMRNSVWRSKDYVISECQHLAAQLAKIGNTKVEDWVIQTKEAES
jgi:hypothetical protein